MERFDLMWASLHILGQYGITWVLKFTGGWTGFAVFKLNCYQLFCLESAAIDGPHNQTG